MDYSHYEYLEMTREGHVLVVSLNRPESLNAMNGKFHTEMSRLFGDIARDRQTEVVVITGRGKAFSAGGDLKWFREMTPEQLDDLFTEARSIIIDLLEVEQPIIAAINGFATGLGATVALFSDIIIASERARIGDPHVQVGVVAGDGGAVIWPWLVGAARAKEFLMTGDLVDAREAERIGLVNRVVAHDELMPTAMALAKRLAEGPTQAIRGTKTSINKILRDTANLVLDTSLALEKQCFHTPDHREAIDAFVEKRRPVFRGKS
uniref:Enoyl-CoA hydratase n=1 Tax=Candidatus Kentrum sp. SD TaxID=2126332 RepID=A0A451BS81_9GAMM|nr:MAG: enoyl-CoA hydratase [Candidatus Kentron sp. SD]VFK49747.1 MAG: enoyl-CoA hydratase [Candidatus Kentron sp. SD]VFK81088.1 MAG: enoyl-CoA hydratase [Candidatus Kentron sp. SD]